MTFLSKEFEEIVAEADQIFIGTVVATPASRLPNGAIVTDVRFTVSQVLKGPRTDAATLRVLGGTADGVRLQLPGVPTFNEGITYIVFVKDNGRAFFPVVGGDHGLFRVAHDPRLDIDVVLDARGAPLADVPVPLTVFADAVNEELRLR